MSEKVDVALGAGVIVVGTCAVLVSYATVPPGSGDDFFASGLFFPTLLLVAVACMAAGAAQPRHWGRFVVAAMVPYFVAWLWLGMTADRPDGQWGLGVPVLAILSIVPIVGAKAGAVLGAKVRDRC